MSTKTLICKQCRGSFEFSEGEQKFYAEKGLQPPRRCTNCRAQPKTNGATVVATPTTPMEEKRVPEIEWINGPGHDGENRRNRRSRGRKDRRRDYDDYE
jgi:hypothetical protein